MLLSILKTKVWYRDKVLGGTQNNHLVGENKWKEQFL